MRGIFELCGILENSNSEEEREEASSMEKDTVCSTRTMVEK